MKVGELIRIFRIRLQFKADRDLCEKYKDEEVIAYAYSDFGGAFIFKGVRNHFAYLNGGRHHNISKVVGLIKNSRFERKNVPEDLKRFAFLDSI